MYLWSMECLVQPPLDGLVNGLLGYSFSWYLFQQFIEENE